MLDAATQALLPGVRSRFAKSGLSLSGALRNSAGVPAPGVPVRLIAQNAGDTAANVVASTTTDAAGHWVLNAPQGPSRKLTIVYGTRPPTPEGGVTISHSVKPTLTLRVRALGRARCDSAAASRSRRSAHHARSSSSRRATAATGNSSAPPCASHRQGGSR